MKIFFLLFWTFSNVARSDDSPSAELLAKASRLGDLKMLQSLLSSGVNPNLFDRYGHAPLHYAASFNQVQAVELLLASHADPNPGVNPQVKWPAPATPLQYAAELGNRRIVSLLIDAGARVNEAGPKGRTALHYANDQLDVIRLLLTKGADLNTRDAEGVSPLDEAIWYGSLDTVAILLAHGAPINELEPKTGATPINEAAFKGDARLVRYLLQFKPDLTTPDNHGFRPLQNAIRMGKEDAAVILLDADAKETPEFLMSALEAAAGKDESALVESLLHHGLSPNGVLPSGSTPLDLGAFSGAGKVVEVLLKDHADPNVSGRNGNRPLEDAALKGFADIVAMLLDHGAEINHINETTALYSAASFGKGDVVKLLLQRGANPNLCGKNQKSPFAAAIENGYAEIAAQIKNSGGGKNCLASESPRR